MDILFSEDLSPQVERLRQAETTEDKAQAFGALVFAAIVVKDAHGADAIFEVLGEALGIEVDLDPALVHWWQRAIGQRYQQQGINIVHSLHDSAMNTNN